MDRQEDRQRDRVLTVTKAIEEGGDPSEREAEDFTLYLNNVPTKLSKWLFASYSKKLREEAEFATIDRYVIPAELGVSINTVRQFCNACQMRPYDMSEENVGEFQKLAVEYKCDSVVEACEEFLPKILVKKAIEEGGDAEERLVGKIKEYLKKPEELLDMSDEQAVRILSKAKEKNILTDREVIQFVLDYADKKKGCKVGEALKDVKLESLTGDDLNNCIRLGQYPERVKGRDAFNLLKRRIGGVEPTRPAQDLERLDYLVGERSMELWNELKTVASVLAWEEDPYEAPSKGLFSKWRGERGGLSKKLKVMVKNGDGEKLWAMLEGGKYTQTTGSQSDYIRFDFKVPVYISWVSLTADDGTDLSKFRFQFEFVPLQYLDPRCQPGQYYRETKKLKEYPKDDYSPTSIIDLRKYNIVTKSLIFLAYPEGDSPNEISFTEFEIKGIELPLETEA